MRVKQVARKNSEIEMNRNAPRRSLRRPPPRRESAGGPGRFTTTNSLRKNHVIEDPDPDASHRQHASRTNSSSGGPLPLRAPSQ